VKHIFDKETSRYLIEVMSKDKNYGYEHYNFSYNSQTFKDIVTSINNYFHDLKKWGNPVLLLFGANDILTEKTCKYYKDNYKEENISIKHLKDASHVTPCMESNLQLTKLNPVISFYKKNHDITPYKPKIKTPIQSRAYFHQ
jgi:hypothetical protein